MKKLILILAVIAGLAYMFGSIALTATVTSQARHQEALQAIDLF
jgi:hypothetical protein